VAPTVVSRFGSIVIENVTTTLDAAPQGTKNAFTVGARADSDSQKADAYWKANQPAKTGP
jgi:hypothetical protein